MELGEDQRPWRWTARSDAPPARALVAKPRRREVAAVIAVEAGGCGAAGDDEVDGQPHLGHRMQIGPKSSLGA